MWIGLLKKLRTLLNDNAEYNRMSEVKNPYGDGKASERIVEIISKSLAHPTK